jgi:hypothetical protein
MKLHLEFKNIVDNPMCRISLGDQELYNGVVEETFDLSANVPNGPVSLTIDHWDKRPGDTIVENDTIIHDRGFELSRVVIDDYDIEELIWTSEFRALDGAVYSSCLYFGPNGKFVLELVNPVLYWILKLKHECNNNDPNWEEDYQYYQNACKLLTLISNR